MKIGLITTLQTNIGDDFIREGISAVLRHVFGDRPLKFVPINKHKPSMAYPSWHPVQWERYVPNLPRGSTRAKRVIRDFAPRLGFSKFHDCDLIVQCGAPVIWPTCGATTHWRRELWEQIIGRLHRRIPVLNLAAGSCYPWERQTAGTETDHDRDYLRMIFDFCRLTTVRDRLAQKVLAALGRDASVIACSASLAGGNESATLSPSSPILINYMAGGGHFDFDQKIDAAKWEQVTRELISRLGKRHRVKMLCHNEQEMELARKIAPGTDCVLPHGVGQYFDVVRRAKAGVFNRMHACVAMAGIGIPSIAVGTDTRLNMVAEFGLPCHYVKDATVDELEAEVERQVANGRAEQERLLALRKATFAAYARAISGAVSPDR